MQSEINESLIDQISRRKEERAERFSEYKLLNNPFTPYRPETAVKSLADRKQERVDFADAFLRLTEGEINHIFIIGTRGMGKSHLLRYFYEEINGEYEKLGIPKPQYFADSTEALAWIRKNAGDLKETVYVFIDDAYLVSFPFVLFASEAPQSNLIYKNKFVKTINCWQKSIVGEAPALELPGISEDFDEIKLTSLKDADELELMKKRIEVSCNERDMKYCLSFFDDTFFAELTKISHGNPRLLLKNASAVFLANVREGKKHFSGQDVNIYTQKMGIKTTKQIEETFERLTPPQKRILYVMCALGERLNKSEYELKEIAHALDISRTAVFQSLISLIESTIVLPHDSEHGRTKYYRISEEYRDFFMDRYKEEIKKMIYKINQDEIKKANG